MENSELLQKYTELVARNEKLEKVMSAAKVLRQAQVVYMSRRGDQELGKAVAVAARELDKTFVGL